MAKQNLTQTDLLKTPFPPAVTPQERDKQLALLATEAIERRIRSGEATAQELVYYAKKGSNRDKIEEQMLENQNKLLEAKTVQIEESRKAQEAYDKVLRAMRKYNGDFGDDDYGEMLQ